MLLKSIWITYFILYWYLMVPPTAPSSPDHLPHGGKVCMGHMSVEY